MHHLVMQVGLRGRCRWPGKGVPSRLREQALVFGLCQSSGSGIPQWAVVRGTARGGFSMGFLG